MHRGCCVVFAGAPDSTEGFIFVLKFQRMCTVGSRIKKCARISLFHNGFMDHIRTIYLLPRFYVLGQHVN